MSGWPDRPAKSRVKLSRSMTEIMSKGAIRMATQIASRQDKLQSSVQLYTPLIIVLASLFLPGHLLLNARFRIYLIEFTNSPWILSLTKISIEIK